MGYIIENQISHSNDLFTDNFAHVGLENENFMFKKIRNTRESEINISVAVFRKPFGKRKIIRSIHPLIKLSASELCYRICS